METVTILCLANSRRHGGHCIAGKVFHENAEGGSFGKWIRPVSARKKRELSPAEIRYDDGKMPKLLDFIEIPLAKYMPDGHQTENYLINTEKPWHKVGSASWSQAKTAVDALPRKMLWVNQESSAESVGKRDLVRGSSLRKITDSLYLIHPDSLKIGFTYNSLGRKQIRGMFQLHGKEYSLVVTDLIMKKKDYPKEDGPYSIQDALLCVSLAMPYIDDAYKLIAGVITPDNNATA